MAVGLGGGQGVALRGSAARLTQTFTKSQCGLGGTRIPSGTVRTSYPASIFSINCGYSAITAAARWTE
jgi:hypothetical protein